MLYTVNFRDHVLLDPIMAGADRLKIVSGYATHTMASWHITEIKSRIQRRIDIDLIVGMCPLDGISVSVHNGFKELIAEHSIGSQTPFMCQYVTEGLPVHSKLYLWERAGRPFLAYTGSANYTQPAFFGRRDEILEDCNPNDALVYFNSIEPRTMYCNHAEIEDRVVLTQAHPVLRAEESPLVTLRGAGVTQITLSLLTRYGDVGFGSGINWGHRRNGTPREPNQAYIPLPSDIARSGFFPLERRHFSVLTDDNRQLILRVEQQNDKAITTPHNNSLLGEYIRGRIGVANGAFISRQDLLDYGRTNVTFYKLDDEQFFMDFSV